MPQFIPILIGGGIILASRGNKKSKAAEAEKPETTEAEDVSSIVSTLQELDENNPYEEPQTKQPATSVEEAPAPTPPPTPVEPEPEPVYSPPVEPEPAPTPVYTAPDMVIEPEPITPAPAPEPEPPAEPVIQPIDITSTEEYLDLQSQLDDKLGEIEDLNAEIDALSSSSATTAAELEDVLARYNAAQADLNNVSSMYDDMVGRYDILDERYGTLQDDYAATTASLQDVTSKYGATREQLEAALLNAQDQQERLNIMNALETIRGQEQSKATRIAAAASQPSVPSTLGAYTEAMGGMEGTALNPNAYTIEPINYGAGLAGLGSSTMGLGTNFLQPDVSGTTDYTDIFAPPEMTAAPLGGYDYGANFNPYYDALREDFGLPSGYGD
jgi:hypothetical protein